MDFLSERERNLENRKMNEFLNIEQLLIENIILIYQGQNRI